MLSQDYPFHPAVGRKFQKYCTGTGSNMFQHSFVIPSGPRAHLLQEFLLACVLIPVYCAFALLCASTLRSLENFPPSLLLGLRLCAGCQALGSKRAAVAAATAATGTAAAATTAAAADSLGAFFLG